MTNIENINKMGLDEKTKNYENLENAKKYWIDIAERTSKYINMSKLNWEKLLPDTEIKLEWAKKEFYKNIEEIEKNTWLSEKEKNEKINITVNEYIWKIDEVIWTNEASQAKQNNDFNKQLKWEKNNYIKKLLNFWEKIQEMLDNQLTKALTASLKKWKEAAEEWDKEQAKSWEKAPIILAEWWPNLEWIKT